MLSGFASQDGRLERIAFGDGDLRQNPFPGTHLRSLAHTCISRTMTSAAIISAKPIGQRLKLGATWGVVWASGPRAVLPRVNSLKSSAHRSFERAKKVRVGAVEGLVISQAAGSEGRWAMKGGRCGALVLVSGYGLLVQWMQLNGLVPALGGQNRPQGAIRRRMPSASMAGGIRWNGRNGQTVWFL